ncbi:CGNR zinc finger domain-containing protein [Streptomyces sp. NPDC055722]
MTARWPASIRYAEAEDAAPGGLGFVVDLLSTASHGKPPEPDLLSNVETAQAWLDASLKALRDADPQAPAEQVALDDRGLRRLRVLRDQLRRVLAGEAPTGQPAIVARTSVTVTAAGPAIAPGQGGVEALRTYALVQLLAASYRDTFKRVKVCANPRCQGAFYDRSKNCSRVWHDVAACGNVENVRAYRARKRAQKTASH